MTAVRTEDAGTVRYVPSKEMFASATEMFYRAGAEHGRIGRPTTTHVVAYGLNIVADLGCGKIRPLETYAHFRDLVQQWSDNSKVEKVSDADRYLIAGVIDLVEGMLK